MNINELRIGNYVSFYKPLVKIPKTGKIAEIYAGFCLITEFSKRVPINYDGIMPIGLTEVILLKCGFLQKEVISNEECNAFCLDIFTIFSLNGKFDFMTKITNVHPECGISAHLKYISYLHELQNLYFSLTDKELNY